MLRMQSTGDNEDLASTYVQPSKMTAFDEGMTPSIAEPHVIVK